ncbi:MAG TPA: ABC transporter ATP-binding protein [Bacilli bacterium]|nr:MAG: putative multidrug export ATP-binding/permease protein [Tenericutes bacterium ADurb.BinA124]HNZ50858.1 ABC transporter ATP-binding protein [Bacilli bacterium]HPX84731.1 ABC transporter ATP-binding protein [Bacilli bacterium]HQC74453.1 ABC transporter ATP-binding protein [Bacilli bacterium]
MKPKGFTNLVKWAKPYAWLVVFIILTTVLNPLLYSYVPQFIKYVVDVIFGGTTEGSITLPSFLLDFFGSFNNQLTAVLVVGMSLLLFQIGRGSIMFFDGYNKGRLAENIAYDMRKQMYSHIQQLPLSYHNNVDTGDLIQRCTSDIDTIKSFLSSQLPQILFIVGNFLAGAWQMGRISLPLMLVTLGVVPISATASIIYYRYVKKKFEEIEEVEAKMTTVLQENVNGVRVVKAFANEIFEIEKFRKQSHGYMHETQKLNMAVARYWSASDFITTMQYAVTMAVAIYLAQKGQVSPGDIIAALMYIGMLVWPIRGLGRIIGDFGKATVAANRVDEILRIPSEFAVDGSETPQVTGDIVFENVGFKFPDTDKHLLNGVNFTINPGETVAIIGRTGSGKSTIANLLVRMLDYESGSIRINGVELKTIKKQWIRQQIGIILQDPFLYATTIYENIKIGIKDINPEKIYSAAQTAAIDKDIKQFEKGYDTLVGEKGVTLSGGQKQRVAIARMLVLDKPVMIFDDSLSAVDTTTDLMIRNSLKERNQKLTSLIITHRITTAKEADKIIVLENGIVTAIGKHEELVHQEGLYQKLWSIQGALESEFVKIVEGGEEHES